MHGSTTFSFTGTEAPSLEVADLWFRYTRGSGWVLRGVNLRLYPGEVALVIGASGSGKTTLLRAITGVGVWIYGGELRGRVLLGGAPLEELPLDRIRRSIQVVNQNPYTHFIEHVVGYDLLNTAVQLYGEKLGRRVFARVTTALKIEGLLGRRFFELSGGQLRRVAVAKALLWDPGVLVLDEPLMWLDDEGVADVVEAVHVARSLGKAVLIFEHRFMRLLHLADSVYVLRGGALHRVEHDLLKKLQRSARPRGNHPPEGSGSRTPGRPLLLVEDVWFRYDRREDWVLRSLSLEVSEGTTTVVYGGNGSGKSTLLKVISGYLKPDRGRVELRSRAVYVPQNIYLFFTEETVLKEFEVVCRSRNLGRQCVERGVDYLRYLGVGVDLEESPFNLSWGQAVRLAVALATAASVGPTVLLLDEPFTGLTYLERLQLATSLAKLGGTYVITTSNEETLALVPAAKVFELAGGTLEELREVPGLGALEAAELCKALGIGVNHGVES